MRTCGVGWCPLLTDPAELRTLLDVPFTDEQLIAVTAPAEPGVIVAGAGSGKTTVMAARVVWLVATGAVAPGEVLGLTFTNKAAAELAQRVRHALARAGLGADGPRGAGVGRSGAAGPDVGAEAGVDAEFDEPTIATYHAYAGRLITEHGLRLGIEPSARLLADATRHQLAARVARRARGPFEHLTVQVATAVSRLIALDQELSDHLVEPAALRAFDEDLAARLADVAAPKAEHRDARDAALARGELLQLVEAFRGAKREKDLLDFSDQMALAARLAQELPEVGRIERDRFAIVLLDEYQDTSVGQSRMLAALFGGGHAVTAVGDPCQGIYGWRGASVANLDEFPEVFRRADGAPARRFVLTENRRSGGRILAFANRLAEPLRDVHRGVEPLRPRAGVEDDGWVRCALLTTHAEELEWMAERIVTLIHHGLPPREIAVLVRANAEFAHVHRALTDRGVAVEVVGLGGLLRLPEVADLVAELEVLDEPTANAALVRLLAGPRWRIGPRDLALLGRRARRLVQVPEDEARGGDRLAQAVAEADPAEMVSLSDAMADPGDDLPFSTEARRRFQRFAMEIRGLRRHLPEPVPEIVHRVLSATGLDVEIAASPSAVAARRAETVAAFTDVAAAFTDLDGDPSLTAFLAFLRTADTFDRGLDSGLPSGEDSVKLMTAHKAKGLEWDVVVVPGLARTAFPSTKAPALWPRTDHMLPTPLRGDARTRPALTGLSVRDFAAFREASAEHGRLEELRLGYVAFTRPRKLLVASGHWWGPTQKTARGPSEFLLALRDFAEDGSGSVEVWASEPEGANPVLDQESEAAWPAPPDPIAASLRHRGAKLVRERMLPRPDGSSDDVGVADGPSDMPRPRDGAAFDAGPHEADSAAHVTGDAVDGALSVDGGSGDVASDDGESCDGQLDGGESGDGGSAEGSGDGGPDGLDVEARGRIAAWDRDLDALVEEARNTRERVRDVPLPRSLTATQIMLLAADPHALARELARPMPRPSSSGARRGTRFHAWVESLFGDLPLLDPDDLPGAEDGDVTGDGPDDVDLAELQESFLRTPYARRSPLRVEAEFRILLGGRVVRGRIDAVYEDTDGYEVVDWKTGRTADADPVQLAVYRLAWAETTGVPLDRVRAAFLHVRSGTVIRPRALPGRAELERLLSEEPGVASH